MLGPKEEEKPGNWVIFRIFHLVKTHFSFLCLKVGKMPLLLYRLVILCNPKMTFSENVILFVFEGEVEVEREVDITELKVTSNHSEEPKPEGQNGSTNQAERPQNLAAHVDMEDNDELDLDTAPLLS